MADVPIHVLVVSQFEPLCEGHGGNHRTYQIVHDLTTLLGQHQVSVLALEQWRQTHPRNRKQNPPGTSGLGIVDRLAYLTAAHPVDLMLGKWGQFNRYSAPDFSKAYQDVVAALPRPLVCIMENAAFGRALLPINKAAGIPTIACPQNIESWDRAIPFTTHDHRLKGLASLAFADEWQVFSECDAVLAISRIEQGLLRGLGIATEYYPYRPVGAIEQYWRNIRMQRENRPVTQGPFVLLGSCAHVSTRLSTERLLAKLASNRAPSAYRFVLAGSRSECLEIPPPLKDCVESRGRITNAEMEALLVEAAAMMVSQDIGFGALTRISEFACAGIPVVASDFVRLTLDAPPGVYFADDRGSSWIEAMQIAMGKPQAASAEAYQAWSRNLATPLEPVLCRLTACCKITDAGAGVPPG